MKHYIEPTVNLLFMEAEDILTISDPCGDDVFDDMI